MAEHIPKALVLASGNRGKLEEFSSLLEPLGFQLTAQSHWDVPEAVEDASSFIENALIKARNACLHTGRPSLADDSGLVVPALGGAPGIHSARYADGKGDDANNQKLLQKMQELQGADRAAYFHCVTVLMRAVDDPVPLVAAASWHGEIADAEHGKGGFGYDPIFHLPDLKCTSAELSREEKSRISHRGRSIRQLLNLL
jgi:XTP/dITP diphosphohydrolase